MYKKSLNKFLYIPSTSAHPPGVLKSTIFGNVCRYWYQNTNTKDYRDQVQKFKKRLEARGHAHAHLVPIFKEVFITLDKESKSPPSTTAKTVSAHVLFQHGEYHPRGISRRNICRTFVDTIGNNSGFDQLIVAYSRPRNIRDALIKLNLADTEGVRASSFFSNWILELHALILLWDIVLQSSSGKKLTPRNKSDFVTLFLFGVSFFINQTIFASENNAPRYIYTYLHIVSSLAS
jgi:hypothetical protein